MAGASAAAVEPATGLYNYVVHAHKPTAVTHALTGHFTGAGDVNLILSRNTRIEIYLLKPEGIEPVLDVPINGRIACMDLFRPQASTSGSQMLFVSTERYQFCILEYDAARRELITRAHGDVQDRIGRPCDIGQLAAIDPKSSMIGMHLYDGLFKVIPMDPAGAPSEAFNVRLEELMIIDIKFLHGCDRPTIAVLYQDTKECRHVKTYEVLAQEKELGPGPWILSNVESGSSMLLPVKDASLGGVFIVGEQIITHYNGTQPKSVPTKPTLFNVYGEIDSQRCLLGDHLGNLHILLFQDGADFKLELLGQTSCASALAYLDNGIVYVGSEFGDSQLVRLATESNPETGSYVEMLESFTNLGPIVDLCVVDLERQGQGQIVSCSGAFGDGSLRVIRSGIGINEQASVELPGIKGVWSLRAAGAQYDSYLVVSFIAETRALRISGEELEEADIDGFDANAQSLLCCSAAGDTLLQVTPQSVRLVSATTLKLVSEWRAVAGSLATVCAANAHQIALSTGGGRIVYIEVRGTELVEVGTVVLEHEVACLDLTPAAGKDRAVFLAAGLWTDITVRVLNLPTLTQVCSESLGGEIIPRSILFATFDSVNYLFCALGDGHLFTFVVDETGQLLSKKKISLGTKPIELNTFASGDVRHVFAASDRPTVAYGRDGKVLYSNVNLKDVSYMCSFHSEGFPNSLAIATETSLMIGTVDDIQKLHIRTVPLAEMPRRIAHMPETHTFCVLTVKFVQDASGDEVETYYVRLLDDQTFEVLHSHQLEAFENVCSVLCCSFEGTPAPVYIVGTAYTFPNEPEPQKGRILAYSVTEGKLQLVSEMEVSGAVYSLCGFDGQLLAGINSKVQLFKWQTTDDGARELAPVCGHHGHILALYVKTRGHFIVVGDLMKSISLLVYKEEESTIEEIARDFNPNWMTAVQILDDDVFLGAENSFNLFSVCKNSDDASEEARARLEVCGEYHLGEFVNVFREGVCARKRIFFSVSFFAAGSLVMRHHEEDGDDEFGLQTAPMHIFGTVSGALGMVICLRKTQFKLLEKVQQSLARAIRAVGDLSHDEWRSFSNERKTAPRRGFIDGDLIETFLDLTVEKMDEVADEAGSAREELLRLIEELNRMH